MGGETNCSKLCGLQWSKCAIYGKISFFAETSARNWAESGKSFRLKAIQRVAFWSAVVFGPDCDSASLNMTEFF
jgi:hypothetical protein